MVKTILKALPVLSSLGIGLSGVSVLLNAWIFFILRRLRASGSSIYNLVLIRHLLLTDAITAVLVIADLGLKLVFKDRRDEAPPIATAPLSFLIRNATYPPALAILVQPASWNRTIPRGYYGCHSYFTQVGLRAAHCVTLLTLTLIAADLYMFIIRALSYRNAFIVRYMPRLLLASWAAAALLAAVTLGYHGALTAGLRADRGGGQPGGGDGGRRGGYLSLCQEILSLAGQFCCVGQTLVDFNGLQLILAVFLASCAIVTYCYARIMHTICRLMQANGERVTSLQHNRRGVATSIAILLLFYALFLPYFLLQFTTTVVQSADDPTRPLPLAVIVNNETLDYYLEVAMVTYTLINPLVYACRLSAVRRHSTRTLADFRQRTMDSVQLVNQRVLRRNTSVGGVAKRQDRDVEMESLQRRNKEDLTIGGRSKHANTDADAEV